jgi:hypothetical protein
MVKQGTHNPLSRGSIPRGPTNSGVSTMDSTWSFYLQNVGSIPARRTSKYNSAGVVELVDTPGLSPDAKA